MADGIRSIHDHIAGRRFNETTRRALQRVIEGESYRQAAAAEGLDYSDLASRARSVPGLRQAHLEAWRKSWGLDFPAMWQRYLEQVEV